MKYVRQSRKALQPIWHLLNRKPWSWTGNKAFNKTKGKRFKELALHLDDDQFRSFCAAVGFVEINWALLESQLDRWVQIAYIRLAIKHDQKNAPTTFNKKHEYLKKVFSDPRLVQFKERADDVLNQAKEMSVIRHDLTHGVMTSIEPTDTFHFELVNRKLLGSGMHRHKEIKFDIRKFPEIADSLVKLGAKSTKLTAELAARFL